MSPIKRNIIIAFLGLVFIALIFTFFYLKNKKDDVITLFGNIEIRTVDLSFQVSGTIDRIFVEEGDYVKEGDLLAILDDRDYKAKYYESIANERALKAQKNEDISKYLRNNPLCADGTISKQECTTLLNKKDLSSAKYSQASANRIYQKNQLDYTRLYAPQDGIITTRAQEKGAKVSANQTVFIMSLNKPIWVRTYIKETDLGNIKYGQAATILTDTINPKTKEKKSYKGFIGYISPQAEFSPKTVQSEDLRVDLVYRIRIYIYETDDFLRQGMPITVKIKLQNEDESDNG